MLRTRSAFSGCSSGTSRRSLEPWSKSPSPVSWARTSSCQKTCSGSATVVPQLGLEVRHGAGHLGRELAQLLLGGDQRGRELQHGAVAVVDAAHQAELEQAAEE